MTVFRLPKKLPHVILPDLCDSQGLMTTRIRPDREGYAMAAPDLRDRPLEAAQLDRVEFVVGKINGKKRRIDQAQAGGRVVIARSVELPEHVIGFFHFQRLFGDTPDMVVRIGRTRERASRRA